MPVVLPETDQKTKKLPPYKVILKNDNVNDAGVVVNKIIEFVNLRKEEATLKMLEAHKTGRSLLLVTHREKAELIQDQFKSCVPPIEIELEAA